MAYQSLIHPTTNITPEELFELRKKYLAEYYDEYLYCLTCIQAAIYGWEMV